MVAITLIASVSVFAQDRVNRQKLNFENKSECLTFSQGWKYNETLGEWIDYGNVISSDKSYKEKYVSLQGPYMKSNSEFTFDSIQIKTVNFQEKKYIMMIISKYSGRYKYPSIREDWKIYKVKMIYFLEENEYEKMKNFNTVKISSVLLYDLEFDEYNETKMLDLIQTELTRKKSEYEIKYPTTLAMYITKTKDNKVRFLTPTTVTSLEGNKYIKPIDVSKCYFETDIDNFRKILM